MKKFIICIAVMAITVTGEAANWNNGFLYRPELSARSVNDKKPLTTAMVFLGAAGGNRILTHKTNLFDNIKIYRKTTGDFAPAERMKKELTRDEGSYIWVDEGFSSFAIYKIIGTFKDGKEYEFPTIVAATKGAEAPSPPDQFFIEQPKGIGKLPGPGIPLYCSTKNGEACRLYDRSGELAEKGDLEAAIQSYRKAIELDDRFCDAMDNLGVLLRREGKLEEAISWYKKSIQVMPTNPMPHMNLASVYSVQEKFDESLAEYNTLITIDSDDPEGYYGLGSVCLKKNELPSAIENLKKAEKLYAKRSSPVIADARYLLGVAYYRLKDFAKTRFYLDQIYDQRQNDPDVNYILGVCCLLESGNVTEARKYLKRAQELGSEIPEEVRQKLNL